jgi:hypothetical protein
MSYPMKKGTIQASVRLRLHPIACISLAIAAAAPLSAQTEPVAEVVNIRFYSNELLNLHHTLYAAAWAGRAGKTQGRVLSQQLPHPLTAPFTPQERAIWDQAVHYYDVQIADRDPLSGRGMESIKKALTAGRLDDPAVDKELRATLEAALPLFHRYFWPEQDRVNRAWIAAVTDRVQTLAPDVIPRLEKTYDSKWFATPVRADAVWVGHWGTAYTSVNPPHSVLSSTDRWAQDWSGAEVVFHEFSHALNFKLQGKLRGHGDLWHAVQFYLTGEVVREVLAARQVDYTPLVYSLGLFDNQWSAYRKTIEGVWAPYLRGRVSMDDAVAGTVIALAPPIAEVANIRFYSDELLNLHHTLYAAAWAGRTQKSRLAPDLPHPLTASFTPEEKAAWDQAVRYYDTHLTSRGLNGMPDIQLAVVVGNLNDPAIDKDLKTALETARPVFRKYFWPELDRANRAWIASTAERVRTIAPLVIPPLEKLYDAKWFSFPVRVDAVWVGPGAFTTHDPTHSTITVTDPSARDWSGAEVVFHELSHIHVQGLSAKLNARLGPAAGQYGELWHAVQFYLTGEVVRDALATRQVEYSPMVYSVKSLFPTTWARYRKPIEDAWEPYLRGRVSMDEAISNTVNALAPPR